MDRNLYLFGAFLLAIILYACRDMDKSKGSGQQAILNQGPWKSLTDSIQSFPTNALLYLNRAELLSQANQHELAHQDYKKAWELEPGEVTAEQFTNSLFMTSQWQAAIDFLEKCTQQFPTNDFFKRRLGEAYLQTGKAKEAMSQFDQLIAQDSNQFEAWYEKGMLAASQADTTTAIASLEKSYAIMPTLTTGLALANMYAEQKNARCLMIADHLLARDSVQELVDPIFIKGIYYANTRQDAKAIEQFDACIKRDWKFNEAYIEKGIVFFEQKNIDEALRIFKLAITVSNTNADAYFWIGRCHESIQQFDIARDYYIKAFSLDPSFIEAKSRIEKITNQP